MWAFAENLKPVGRGKIAVSMQLVRSGILGCRVSEPGRVRTAAGKAIDFNELAWDVGCRIARAHPPPGATAGNWWSRHVFRLDFRQYLRISYEEGA